MTTHRTLGCDATDPHRLAAFRALALGYAEEAPTPRCATGRSATRSPRSSPPVPPRSARTRTTGRLDHVAMTDPEGTGFRVA